MSRAEEVAGHRGPWVVAGTTRMERAKAEKQELHLGIKAAMNRYVQAKHKSDLVSNQYYDNIVLTITNRVKRGRKVAHGPTLLQLNSTVRPSDIAWRQPGYTGCKAVATLRMQWQVYREPPSRPLQRSRLGNEQVEGVAANADPAVLWHAGKIEFAQTGVSVILGPDWVRQHGLLWCRRPRSPEGPPP